MSEVTDTKAVTTLTTTENNEDDVDSDVEKTASIMTKLDTTFIFDQKAMFDDLMKTFPVALGKSVSKKEREEKQLKRDTNLVYGEVTFEALATVIEKIKKVYGLPNAYDSGAEGFLQPGQRGMFYDLGSGTGKGVVSAALAHNFDTCCGIELLEGLHSVALDVMNIYNTKGKAKLNRESDTLVQLVLGDMLNLRVKDWRNADVLFINSTCYDEGIMMKIAQLGKGMKKGSFVISLTKQLPSDEFNVLEYELYNMSWGEATIFISQKTTDPSKDDMAVEEKEESSGSDEDYDD